MTETIRVPQINQGNEEAQRYFSFQIKGWTNFDPMHKTLARIAQEIEDGSGFLTLVEVLKTENNLASIDDDEVRECFENILAAKRLIQNAHGLPKKLFDDLRSVLQDEEQAARRKTVTPVTTVNEKSGTRSRPWP
jgi:hypothetical protein